MSDWNIICQNEGQCDEGTGEFDYTGIRQSGMIKIEYMR